MSTIDQCPSTKGKIEITDDLAGVAGSPSPRRYWRSVEDFSNDAGFREFVHREFPAGASEIAFTDKGKTRRGFLKLMGASLALAGAATIPGCRRPDHKLVPYGASEPEHVIPGQPLYFATSMPLPGGGAEGLLIETHQGRPTKVEGNPLHPVNRGKSSVWSQASILELYDPDRLKFPRYKNPTRGRLDATWDDFALWWSTDRAAKHRADDGRSLAVICDFQTGPTVRAMRERLLKTYPRAKWVWWDPVDARRSQIDGTKIAFGDHRRVSYEFEGARCVLSLDSDFLTTGPNQIPEARGFAATRRVEKPGDAMSRLYVCEAHPSGTGSLADHRWRMTPAQITAFAAEVARVVLSEESALRAIAEGIPVAPLSSEGMERAHAVAKDLLEHAAAHAGSAVVVAGSSQPAEVHALVAALNYALRAPVRYLPMSDDEAADPMAALSKLAAEAKAGEVSTLVTIGVNPLYDAPSGVDFTEVLGAVSAHVAWSVLPTETSAAATWEINGACYLESWGDTESYDGTIAPVQPMIAPLYEPATSMVEFIAFLAGEERPDGYELVRSVWASAMGGSPSDPAFEKRFRRALHDGVVPGGRRREAPASFKPGALVDLVRGMAFAAEPAAGSLEIVFESGRLGDGRFANNGWLQELPQKGTSVVWENPVVLSPATAKELRLLPEGGMGGMYTSGQIPQARLAELTIDGVSQTVAVWVCPGVADGVAHVQLGYGRQVCGSVGEGVGFNAYPMRGRRTRSVATGTLRPSGGTRDLASTQNHWSLEGRTSLVRALDKKWFDKHAGAKREDKADKIYGTPRVSAPLNLAEKMGELSHTPDNVSSYDNPFNESAVDPKPGSAYSKGPQWGMTIDLASCTGCNLCTVACQSENNIPIVGRTEVAKGREMQWIRVDRYFAGNDLNDPTEMICQPVACVHCENAPCEVVCPVTATVHGPEGTNNMAYNRCIGTRYCANNCPYKVRRFNFFDYGVTKYNGAFFGEKALFGDEGIEQNSFNKNLIPPRLREKLEEISHMRHNPDVTVRSRGVMEKCSYCIQRINGARQESKVRGLWTEAAPIPDGFFQVACQQACPTDSIVFGDILDKTSKVSASRESERSYMLLGYLNTRPRTSHMLRVRNPNPAIGVFDEHDPLDHGGGHEDGHAPADGHGEGDHGGHSFVDPVRRFMDDGYRTSLRVLS